MMIFRSLHEGKHTFTEIKEDIGEISANLLTERLNELIATGYITKDIISVQPVKIQYNLTKQWKKLSSIIALLVQFAWGICKK